MENWDTSNGCTFAEMFNDVPCLKELDLSKFDTRNAYRGYVTIHSGAYMAFDTMFANMASLEKLTLGEYFVFDGNGDPNNDLVVLPAPAAIDGQATKWYDAENDVYYDASEIPDETAATYIAKIPE